MSPPRPDRYVPHPDGGWECLHCTQLRRRGGPSWAVARVQDPAGHDEWHERQPFGGLPL